MRNAVMGIAAVAAALVFSAPQSGATVVSGGVPKIGQDGSLVEQVRSRGGRGFHSGRAYRGGQHAFRSGHFRSHRFSGHRFSGHRFSGNRFHGRRHFRHGRWWYGAPFIYGAGYYDDCGWLRRRAIVTGSHYWWRRYRVCRGW